MLISDCLFQLHSRLTLRFHGPQRPQVCRRTAAPSAELLEDQTPLIGPAPYWQEDLVAHLPIAGDATGKGHNGTVKSAVLTVDRLGPSERALGLDGINDSIVSPTTFTVRV